MTISTSSRPEPQRIRGFEMPWNRALRAPASAPEQAAGATRALGPWLPQEFAAECVEVYPHSGSMMTFVFRRVDGAPLAFRPGQYLNILFPVHGADAEPVDRSYSISSSPTQPWTFDITVKRDAHGLVSGWAHDHLHPGDVLEMLGPVGAFHLPDADRRARYLFLAAGAGITPLMSMVRTVHRLPGRADIKLLYHAASPDGFTFSRELEWLVTMDSRIKVFYALGNRGTPASWSGMSGRLTAAMIDEVAPDAPGRQIYACGPEGYLHAAEQFLFELGVDDTSIHMEFFSGDRQTEAEYRDEVIRAGEVAEEVAAAEERQFAAPPDRLDMFVKPDPAIVDIPHTAASPGDGAHGAVEAADTKGPRALDVESFTTVGEGEHRVSFTRSQLNVMVTADEPILPAAQRAGVRIGMNCQQGMCGSCKSLKLEGDVDMKHQGGIRAREIDAGKFLPCCSTARSDLIVDA